MAETYALKKDRKQTAEAESSGGGSRSGSKRSGTSPEGPQKSGRLVSLDAYRGFIMTMLAASGFGIARLARLPEDAAAWKTFDYEKFQRLAFHFDHPPWESIFGNYAVSFWDLIQPAFMFMVGVAMPFSYARRLKSGESDIKRTLHAAVRAIVLVLLGVFLYSQGSPRTNWIFPNVLAQIGLGYFFAYLLLGRRLVVQLSSLSAILIGSWLMFYLNPPPENYDYEAVGVDPDGEAVYEGRFAAWSKNANVAYQFDNWLLPKLRTVPQEPEPEEDAPDASDADQDTGNAAAPDAAAAADETEATDSPDATASDDAAPADGAPADTEPDDAKPEDATSDGAPAEDAVPDDTAADDNTPTNTADTDTSNTAAGGPEPADADTPADAEETEEPQPDNQPGVAAAEGRLKKWLFSNPQPYIANGGGYTTLNFIPSIATMLLGILCGQLLLFNQTHWKNLMTLVVAAAICLGLGILAHHTVCPIIKRIWTPSWALFSGGYVMLMLAAFYLVFDILPLRWLAFPLVVVGMNSLLFYMMGQLVRSWVIDKVVHVHLAGFLNDVFGPLILADEGFGRLTEPIAAFVIFWLIGLWLYRSRHFLRI